MLGDRHPRRDHSRSSLELTIEQQTVLRDHGFGPDSAADFRDPAVRARLVEALRAGGALRDVPAAAAGPPPLRRAG